MIAVFLSRLLLYFTAVSAVLFHKGIAVSYDTAGIVLYFILIPVMAVFGYLPSRRTLRTGTGMTLKVSLVSAAAITAVTTLFFAGMGAAPWKFIGYGAGAYLLTLALFRFKWFSVSALEVLFTAGIYVRLINFTRGSEQIARTHEGFTRVLLFIALGALAAHILVLYRASATEHRAREGNGQGRKPLRDYLILLLVIVPVLLVSALLVSPDYIEHSVVFNQLFNKAEPDPSPIDGNPNRDPGGSIRGNEGLETRRGRNGEPGLSGIPSDQWGEQTGGGTGIDKQYAVMVVASKQDPVYLADDYKDRFDSREGFYPSADNPLNELVFTRFVETWENPLGLEDTRRLPTDVAVFSVRRERVLAYYPVKAAPLVFNTRYHPFNYSYESVSEISIADRWDWTQVPELSDKERTEYAGDLAVPLDEATEKELKAYLAGILDGSESPGEKVLNILMSFKEHQYNLGFKEDTSVAFIRDFLLVTKTGDCTEFSNAAALLGRLAGVPSRVVTGYLASSGLQTRSHLFGLYNLKQNMPPLEKYPIQDLFLVTTAHRHSWPQFYLPGLGWIDFESTDYAIPPPPGGDANEREVVIPLISEQTVRGENFRMPWRLLFQILVTGIVAGTAALYILQGFVILMLKRKIRTPSIAGVRAAERLLLISLIRDGKPPRRYSQTLTEYADTLEGIRDMNEFAGLYNELRFRLHLRNFNDSYTRLASLCRSIPEKAKNKGFSAALARLFSLKGLRYL
ncbi:MAG: transglutaminase domain-containing protein [Spirochaetales bacterium]|nr:transglutaminase domain-containing protein [Spirochaetales bacterium]